MEADPNVSDQLCGRSRNMENIANGRIIVNMSLLKGLVAIHPRASGQRHSQEPLLREVNIELPGESGDY